MSIAKFSLTPVEAAQFFPKDRLGIVTAIEPLNMGMSGSLVYSVATDRGEYILRLHRVECDWDAFIRNQVIAAEHGIGPAIFHVDAKTRTIVSEKVTGSPFSETLKNPDMRRPVIASLLTQLSKLHSIEVSHLAVIDPLDFSKEIWREQTARTGFPKEALQFSAHLENAFTRLERDTRRVFSHSDLHPGNLIWDGRKVWLVDWERATLAHPYLDLATISNFLSLPDETALDLLSASQQSAIGEEERLTFLAMRDLVRVIYACVFIRLIPDLSKVEFAQLEQTPTLSECLVQSAAKALDMASPQGCALTAAGFFKQCLK